MIIQFEKSFEKDFKKLSSKMKEQFYLRLRILEQDKFSRILHNHKLAGRWNEYYSINISGDIRAIYQNIENKENKISFVAIGSHSKLYK